MALMLPFFRIQTEPTLGSRRVCVRVLYDTSRRCRQQHFITRRPRRRERERYLFFAATPKVDCLIRLIRRKAKINPKETHARPQEAGNYCGHLPNMAPNGFALGERAAKQFLNLHIGLQNKRE